MNEVSKNYNHSYITFAFVGFSSSSESSSSDELSAGLVTASSELDSSSDELSAGLVITSSELELLLSSSELS